MRAAAGPLVLTVAVRQTTPDAGLPPLFVQQNLCFEEAGLPPIRGADGGQAMDGGQFAVFDACMDRAIPGRQGAAMCSSTRDGPITCGA